VNTSSEWLTWKLEECCDILDSKRIPVNSEDREKRIGNIPYYGANGLQGYINDFIFDEPLILIAEDGGRFDEFATQPIAYRISGKSWVNNHAHVLRAKNDFSQDAIFYTLEHKDIQSCIVGGTRAKLNQGALRSITIQLPEYKPEQSKIAEVISTVDRAIEQTEGLIAKQQRIKTGLMQDILTRGIDEHGNLRSEETHEFKDSPVGRIPVEWEPIQLGRLASLQRGHDITEEQLRDGPFPVITSSGIIGYHSQATSRGPNVVIGRKGTIGKVHYIENDFWAHDTSLYVTNFWGNHELFVYYLFFHLDLAKFGTKSGSPSLNRNDISALWIGRPSYDEQIEISKSLNQSIQYSETIESQLKKLRSLKTALMQDLLTGKVRVTPLLEKMEACL